MVSDKQATTQGHGLVFSVSLLTIFEFITLGGLSGALAEVVVCAQAEWLKISATFLAVVAFLRICASVRKIVEERGVV